MSKVTALALLRDLFFRSKLDAAAEASGAEVIYASSLEQARARCAGQALAAAFVDLSDKSFPAAETAACLRQAAPAIRLIGFASHVELKGLASARQAGFDLTLSREEFAARLPELLRE